MVGFVLPASILWRALSSIPALEASDAWVNLKRLRNTHICLPTIF
tara:strand:+ start:1910 stop:2044 length:135 start_codon:yes stop_codon:yes gene_type:complete